MLCSAAHFILENQTVVCPGLSTLLCLGKFQRIYFHSKPLYFKHFGIREVRIRILICHYSSRPSGIQAVRHSPANRQAFGRSQVSAEKAFLAGWLQPLVFKLFMAITSPRLGCKNKIYCIVINILYHFMSFSFLISQIFLESSTYYKFYQIKSYRTGMRLAYHGSPKWPKHEKNCLAQTPYFFGKGIPWGI